MWVCKTAKRTKTTGILTYSYSFIKTSAAHKYTGKIFNKPIYLNKNSTTIVRKNLKNPIGSCHTEKVEVM